MKRIVRIWSDLPYLTASFWSFTIHWKKSPRTIHREELVLNFTFLSLTDFFSIFKCCKKTCDLLIYNAKQYSESHDLISSLKFKIYISQKVCDQPVKVIEVLADSRSFYNEKSKKWNPLANSSFFPYYCSIQCDSSFSFILALNSFKLAEYLKIFLGCTLRLFRCQAFYYTLGCIQITIITIAVRLQLTKKFFYVIFFVHSFSSSSSYIVYTFNLYIYIYYYFFMV